MPRLKRQYGRKRLRSRRRGCRSDEIARLVRKVLKNREHDAKERPSLKSGTVSCARSRAYAHRNAFDTMLLTHPGMRDENITALIEMLSLARQEASESLEDAYAAEIIGECIWRIMHRFGYLRSEGDWSRAPTMQ